MFTDFESQLTQFRVERTTGFLIREEQMAPLPRELLPWQELVLEIPQSIEKLAFGRRVDELPELRLSPNSAQSAELAKLLLGMIAQAYVWEPVTRPDGAPRLTIPRQVAVPLVEVSRMLAEPPVFNYADFVLRDWGLFDPDGGVSWRNVSKRFLFTGDREEVGFAAVHVEYEALAGAAIVAGLSAVEAAEHEKLTELESSLVTLENALAATSSAFDVLLEAISPEFFRSRLRIFLQGWKNTVPMVYEGTDVAAHELRGETGAQSSVLPFADAVLGLLPTESIGVSNSVVRTSPSESSSISKAALDYHDFDTYRPKLHREFVDHVRKQGQVRDVVATSGVRSLQLAYNACLLAVRNARISHLRAVGAYLPPSAASRVKTLGTGGTEYAVYLRALIDETAASVIS